MSRISATWFPPTIGLTDQETGTVYYLRFRDGRVVLTPNVNGALPAVVHPAGQGPSLGTSGVKLFVRSGRLGFARAGAGVVGQRLYLARGVELKFGNGTLAVEQLT